MTDLPPGIEFCLLCHERLEREDPRTWKQVKGWVGGPRKDSMRLREDTGHYAHDECVGRAQAGLTPEDSISLFEDTSGPPLSSWSPLPEELT